MWILMLLDPTGIRHAVEVMSSEWSIESIVTKATEATGIQPDDMVLKFGGRELQAGKKLTSYGVQHGSEIQIQAKAGRWKTRPTWRPMRAPRHPALRR